MGGADWRLDNFPGNARPFITRLTRGGTTLTGPEGHIAPPAQVKPARGDLNAGARDLFGHGGRLFVTTADPPGGWISSLVQADGDIVTRATADSVADLELLQRHNLQIAQWLASLQREWRSIEMWADRVAEGAALVTVGGGTALAVTSHGALALTAFAGFATVAAARAAGATIFRRRVLRVN